MAYVHVLADRELIRAFEAAASGKLKVGEVDEEPEGAGLFFDLSPVWAILVWINDNKDLLAASATLASSALGLLGDGKGKGGATIIIKAPDGSKAEIEVSGSGAEVEIGEKLSQLTKIDAGATGKDSG